jgi:hypothetical protein
VRIDPATPSAPSATIDMAWGYILRLDWNKRFNCADAADGC